jgi:hypothetical protein
MSKRLGFLVIDALRVTLDVLAHCPYLVIFVFGMRSYYRMK